ncbi:MAG: hypothetical protein KF795_14190 [Labilithrix sp.]|nr:hypothetical protein [Labilithrix sp.]
MPPQTHLIRPVPDEALARAAKLLAAQGRRREAIVLVERAIRDRTTADHVLLLALLLLDRDAPGDRRVANAYLQRLQCHIAEMARAVRKRD